MGNPGKLIARRVACALFSASLAASASAQAPMPPKVDSESFILMDAFTGAVMAEKDADKRLPPASLTKIMTAYMGFRAVASNAIAMDDTTQVSRRAWAQKVIGSKTFLQVGTQVSVHDLLHGIAIQSGNDAAIALAEMLAGGEQAFAAAMNEEAEKMGLENTRFMNSTGLPQRDHYSSARDVAIMVQKTILNFPDEYRIYAKHEFTYNNITQSNRNGLLHDYEGADGAKTGHTRAAGYCLAASAHRDGRRLIAVVMRSRSPAVRERESANLLDFGFSEFVNQMAFDDKRPLRVKVYQGEKDFIEAMPEEPGLTTVERGRSVAAVFEPAAKPLPAPLGKGDVVGEIVVLVDGKEIRRIAVRALEASPEAGFFKRWGDYVRWKYLDHDYDNALLS